MLDYKLWFFLNKGTCVGVYRAQRTLARTTLRISG